VQVGAGVAVIGVAVVARAYAVAASVTELSDEGAVMADDERADNEVRPEPDDPQAPDDPQSNPEQAVDAMEQRVLGDSPGFAREDEDEDEDLSPAFEQDLDPQDQGSAEAAAEQSG
jgi:hypothetical protein